MHLSHLLINTSSSSLGPSGCQWVRDAYRVHQRLCMGFKDEGDVFIPHDLVDGSPHEVVRTKNDGFLFRVDMVPGRSDRHIITVQSAMFPAWERAFHSVPDYLAGPPRVSPFDPDSFEAGCEYRFRLRANPVLCSHGKRVALRSEEEQRVWLTKRASDRGFDVLSVEIRDRSWWHLRNHDRQMTLLVAQYEGILRVVDSNTIAKTIVSGVGRAKGFGLGLLSLVPKKHS